jgi:hypothetical protein
MNRKPQIRESSDRNEQRDSTEETDSQATFWHWFAIAALLFAWIAEATMCAERGF